MPSPPTSKSVPPNLGLHRGTGPKRCAPASRAQTQVASSYEQTKEAEQSGGQYCGQYRADVDQSKPYWPKPRVSRSRAAQQNPYLDLESQVVGNDYESEDEDDEDDEGFEAGESEDVEGEEEEEEEEEGEVEVLRVRKAPAEPGPPTRKGKGKRRVIETETESEEDRNKRQRTELQEDLEWEQGPSGIQSWSEVREVEPPGPRAHSSEPMPTWAANKILAMLSQQNDHLVSISDRLGRLEEQGEKSQESIRELTEQVGTGAGTHAEPVSHRARSKKETPPKAAKTAFTTLLRRLMGIDSEEPFPEYPLRSADRAKYTLSDEMDVSAFAGMEAGEVSSSLEKKPLRIHWSRLTTNSAFENALVGWTTRSICGDRKAYNVKLGVSEDAIKRGCKESLRSRRSRLKQQEQDRATYKAKEATKKQDGRRRERLQRRVNTRREAWLRMADRQDDDPRADAIVPEIVSPDESQSEVEGGILRPHGWSSMELLEWAAQLDLAAPRRRVSYHVSRPTRLADPATGDPDYRVPAKAQRWMVSAAFAAKHPEAVTNVRHNRKPFGRFGEQTWGEAPSDRRSHGTSQGQGGGGGAGGSGSGRGSTTSQRPGRGGRGGHGGRGSRGRP